MSDMSDRDFIKYFSGLIAAIAGIVVILFIIAQFVGAQNADSNNQGTGVAANGAAQRSGVSVASLVDSLIPAARADENKLGEDTYHGTCFACHGTGAAGAPIFGNKAAWAPHIAKGLPTLYTHAINGFQGTAGFMPAKGGNASLSDDAVKAAVRYMVDHSK